jgi:aryl-alcohol dehydrogenase-like predicted oxidoreductase
MKFRKLGTTNVDVSVICLGTMTWGEQNTQKEAFEQMDYASEMGVNFFDTAELYPVPPGAKTYGRTEQMIGNWFKEKKNREKIVLATKVAGPRCNWIRGGENNFNEKNISAAIEGSLKRLKTDYIDLYQLHWPERAANNFGQIGYIHKDKEGKWNDFESILKTLEKFIKSGKIKYIGVSNETPYGLSKYLEISQNKNLPRMMSIQNPYSLVNRTYEIGLSEISIRDKCGLLAYYPLATGYLSGKYRNNQKPKNSRQALFKGWERFGNPRAVRSYDKYYDLAKEFKMSATQLALAFVNSRDFVTSNIIGATSLSQLKENISSIDIDLNDEIIEKINLINSENPNPAP